MQEAETSILKAALEQARHAITEADFCGFGVIVYSDLSQLPVFPLCHRSSEMELVSLGEQIAKVSRLSEPCHDGFQLVTQDWQLTHRNQYFAPPIDSKISADCLPSKDIGARYLSALFGSKISGVICIGIVSERDGLVIFKDGKEVAFP